MKSRDYTTPTLKKGKEPTKIPKDSSKAKEWAKNIWYVEYYYLGKQIRIKQGLNKIKDHRQKQYEADVLLLSIKQDLEDGFNPLEPTEFIEKAIRENITLKDAVQEYLNYHNQIGSRTKTIQSYNSKLRYLIEIYPTILLKELSTKDIEAYCLSKSSKWTNKTMIAAKLYFTGFFNWAISNEYIKTSPMVKFDKSIRGLKQAEKRNIEFTEKDFNKIICYCDEQDKYLAFVLRFCYYTCIRPTELRQLQLKDINLEKNEIFIPAHISKNRKDEFIHIPPQLSTILSGLQLDKFSSTHFINGCTTNFIGAEKVGVNTPYAKMAVVLKKLNLYEKGYTLYSIKHYAGSARMRTGDWSLSSMQKVNRHSTVQMTENYLKNLSTNTEISALEVPTI